MRNTKLFIGRKIRELRETHRLTQSGFADRLGISTSYLNQIENNQRSVSAAVLMALAETFRLDLAELSTGEGDRLLSALSEALTDPVFDSYRPTLQEMKLVTQNAPGFAHALIAAHQAYRRNSEQLASVDDRIGHSAGLGEPSPYEEVRDFFHFVDNYIHDLDLAAEELASRLGIPERDPSAALPEHLLTKHRVRCVRSPAEDEFLRRYDAEARTLHLNPFSPVSTRSFQAAFQIAMLEMDATISAIVRDAGFRTAEASEICRIGLGNYVAGALMMPYEAFLTSAREFRHDLELLATRFGASIEQVSHRLSTLQRPSRKGVPIFFARIDRAGNITKRHSAAKLQFARFGAACPLWNVHQAFETPGRIIRQLAETPDGARYLCMATEIAKGGGGFRAPQRRYAIAVGCEVTHAGDFVYADDLDLTNRAAFDPIGISCRICERTNCAQRAVPPLKRRLVVDHDLRGAVPYRLD
ncbi:XRE family transcriptional regulator [Mesorhizobium sp. CAU 1732]|uniref:helix-turn-helix domain-containing protein n=1 Tax=Mesorhizobium sp. CAU 1732 TaxID=3140358 RepID=UPI003261AEA0